MHLSTGRLTHLLAANCAYRDREKESKNIQWKEEEKRKRKKGRKKKRIVVLVKVIYFYYSGLFFLLETRGVPQLRPVPPTIPTHPLSY